VWLSIFPDLQNLGNEVEAIPVDGSGFRMEKGRPQEWQMKVGTALRKTAQLVDRPVGGPESRITAADKVNV